MRLSLPAFLVALALSVLSLPAPAQMAPSPAPLGSQDQSFVRLAAIGDIAEIEAARVAQEKANSSAVKGFAQKMIEDHTKAYDKLMALAVSKKIALPTALDAEHQKKVTDLHAKAGPDFDRAYLTTRLDAHNKTALMLDQQVKAAQDPEIKALASETRQVVKQHLEMIARLIDQTLVVRRR